MPVRSRQLARALLVASLLGCAASPPPALPTTAKSIAPPDDRAASSPPPPVPEAPPPASPPDSPSPRPPAAPARPAPPTPAPAPALTPPPRATLLLAKDPLVDQILSGGGATLRGVLAAPERHRFQVLYATIAGSPPVLERRGWRADAEYFFPASSMKMPIALATYDRLAALRAAGKRGMTRDATIRIHPTAAGGEPYVTTVARETWRSLIVSDNFSANRLLGIGGHREINETAWALGLKSTRVRTGFATGAEMDPAEMSPRVEFLVPNGAPEELPARKSDLVLPPTDASGLDVGKSHVTDSGKRVDAPLSFADKNAIRLRDLQDTLVRIMRPELLAPAPTDTASKEDLAYLRETLGTLPSASGLAGYDRNVVADYQLVPFLRGIDRVRPRGSVQIFSKVGQAYGFLIANAYVVEKATGKAFFLAAAIYANPDETMNDDHYGYDTTSFPALADVGEVFARHAFAPVTVTVTGGGR